MSHELRLGQPRVVHAQRVSGEHGEHVQIRPAGAGIDDAGTGALLKVDDDVESIHQHDPLQGLHDFLGSKQGILHLQAKVARARACQVGEP